MSENIRKMIDKVNDISNDIDSGVYFVYEQHPEFNSIGTPKEYSEYLKTIFPNSKVKEIVYHGSDKRFDDFNKSYIGKNGAANGYGFYFTNFLETAEEYGEPIAALVNLQRPSKKSLGYSDIIDKERYDFLPDEYKVEYSLIKDGPNKGYYKIRLDGSNDEDWEEFSLRMGKAAYNNIKKVYDGVYTGKPDYIDSEIYTLVFEPEQIHILGSKKDFERFKQFMKNKLDFN